MFVPMWIFYASVSIYLTIGWVYCFVALLSGPEPKSVRDFLACLLLWPRFLLKH